ncbi:MAG: hypothetical protein AAF889_02280 [Cyanobacteria bacterium P01_D01_bin.73]
MAVDVPSLATAFDDFGRSRNRMELTAKDDGIGRETMAMNQMESKEKAI